MQCHGCAQWACSVNTFFRHLYINSVDGGAECQKIADFVDFVDFVINLTWLSIAVIVNQGKRHTKSGDFIPLTDSLPPSRRGC